MSQLLAGSQEVAKGWLQISQSKLSKKMLTIKNRMEALKIQDQSLKTLDQEVLKAIQKQTASKVCLKQEATGGQTKGSLELIPASKVF